MGHNHLPGTNQVVGTSMRVGSKIFNIVGGLGFVDGRNRGFVQLRRGGLGLHLLHKLKKLGGEGGRLRS